MYKKKSFWGIWFKDIHALDIIVVYQNQSRFLVLYIMYLRYLV